MKESVHEWREKEFQNKAQNAPNSLQKVTILVNQQCNIHIYTNIVIFRRKYINYTAIK